MTHFPHLLFHVLNISLNIFWPLQNLFITLELRSSPLFEESLLTMNLISACVSSAWIHPISTCGVIETWSVWLWNRLRFLWKGRKSSMMNRHYRCNIHQISLSLVWHNFDIWRWWSCFFFLDVNFIESCFKLFLRFYRFIGSIRIFILICKKFHKVVLLWFLNTSLLHRLIFFFVLLSS